MAAALVFVHAPSSNAAAIYGGERPVLERSDPRIRPVPFTTRRPTFSETKRVLTTLLSVQTASLPTGMHLHISSAIVVPFAKFVRCLASTW
jgi:hypothetical protein